MQDTRVLSKSLELLVIETQQKKTCELIFSSACSNYKTIVCCREIITNGTDRSRPVGWFSPYLSTPLDGTPLQGQHPTPMPTESRQRGMEWTSLTLFRGGGGSSGEHHHYSTTKSMWNSGAWLAEQPQLLLTTGNLVSKATFRPGRGLTGLVKRWAAQPKQPGRGHSNMQTQPHTPAPPHLDPAQPSAP